MKTLHQKGFTLIEGLLIFLVIAVIAGVGYITWNKQRTKTAASTSTMSTPNSSPSNSSDLVVKEWGVKVTIPSKLTGVTYVTAGNTATLNSDQQKQVTTCGSELSPQTAWGIKREVSGTIKSPDGSALSDSEANTNAFYIHIGNYYYHRVYPQQGCSSATTQISIIDGAYSTLFTSLVAN